jgi:hypothetical protein
MIGDMQSSEPAAVSSENTPAAVQVSDTTQPYKYGGKPGKSQCQLFSNSDSKWPMEPRSLSTDGSFGVDLFGWRFLRGFCLVCGPLALGLRTRVVARWSIRCWMSGCRRFPFSSCRASRSSTISGRWSWATARRTAIPCLESSRYRPTTISAPCSIGCRPKRILRVGVDWPEPDTGTSRPVLSLSATHDFWTRMSKPWRTRSATQALGARLFRGGCELTL